MSYLDIIKDLEEKLFKGLREKSLTGEPSLGEGRFPSEGARVRSEPNEHCEKSELSEKSALSPSEARTQTNKAAESDSDPIWTPPLGRKNDRGELVLTVADLPELEQRLRLSGWKVTRRGNELICSSQGALRIQ